MIANDNQIEIGSELFFGEGNAKLGKEVATFSLPAGHTCPFALLCKSSADRITGKVTDGKHTQFRCFAASAEWNKSVRNSRWTNFELVKRAKTVKAIAALLETYLPEGYPFIRIHVSGDFFNEVYFLAWLEVARNNPGVTFYAYTKALPLWVKHKSTIPGNLILTASRGGTHDSLIEKHGLRFAQVVFNERQAKKLGLEIDHDDSHAQQPGKSFALLLHGTQPAGSEAAEAMKELKAAGIKGYSREKHGRQMATA